MGALKARLGEPEYVARTGCERCADELSQLIPCARTQGIRESQRLGGDTGNVRAIVVKGDAKMMEVILDHSARASSGHCGADHAIERSAASLLHTRDLPRPAP